MMTMEAVLSERAKKDANGDGEIMIEEVVLAFQLVSGKCIISRSKFR
jgi:hypothetical protein